MFDNKVNEYTLILVLATLLAFGWFFWQFHRKKLPQAGYLFPLLLPTIPIAILGARFWTYLFDQTLFDKIGELSNLWKQLEYFFGLHEDGLAGLSIHGGILFSGFYLIIIFLLQSNKYRISFWIYADLIVQSLLICQIIGRWGNFFNHELLGPIIKDPGLWKSLFPRGSLNFEYESDDVVRMPLFLYESLANFILFLSLISLPKSFNFIQKQYHRILKHPERKIKLSKTSPKITFKSNKLIQLPKMKIEENYEEAKTELTMKLFGIKRIWTLLKLRSLRNSQELTKVFDQTLAQKPLRVGTQFSFYFIGYGLIRLILQNYRFVDDYLIKYNPNDAMQATDIMSILFLVFGFLCLMFVLFIHPRKFRSHNWRYEVWYRF